MKKSIFVLMIALMGTLLGSSIMVQGQTNAATNGLSLGLPELNLLSSASTSINLQLTTAVAGAAVKSSISDSTARVKISSVVAAAATRKISAKVTGTIPGGTKLLLRALNPNSNFGGNMGNLIGSDVQLSTSDADIVTNIGSCYSSTGSDDGYVLKYTWGLNNPASTYGDVRATSGTAITVTLTLSAGS
ncbi:MAG TPA: hypothetical protein VIK10_04655 [Prolixibacteraceae bacterium]